MISVFFSVLTRFYSRPAESGVNQYVIEAITKDQRPIANRL